MKTHFTQVLDLIIIALSVLCLLGCKPSADQRKKYDDNPAMRILFLEGYIEGFENGVIAGPHFTRPIANTNDRIYLEGYNQGEVEGLKVRNKINEDHNQIMEQYKQDLHNILRKNREVNSQPREGVREK